MARIKEGDIFEINTAKGKAYLHYICTDIDIGALVRVLPGLFINTPKEIESLASLPERYMLFFPLSVAQSRKIVKHVGWYDPKKFAKPSYMRSEHFIQGEFLGWFIINTDTWQRDFVKSLNSSQKKLSPWGVWNDTLLVDRLESDWSLEKWC